MTPGRLESIWITPDAKARPRFVQQVTAIVGLGLKGDRYARGAGTFSVSKFTSSRDLTLISTEAVEHVRAESCVPLEPGDLRRNLVISGLDLSDLVGARLRIGEVLVECTSTCPPCGHLDRLAAIDSRTLLRRRGGLRAAILEGGELEVGQRITIESPPRKLP